MIIPSIDLQSGLAVQLVGGKDKALDAGDPRPIAELFGRVGEIAVIDLDAALGLKQLKGELSVNPPAADYLLSRLNRPTPRVEEGVLLRDLATACIDISDGLISDLGHIVKASGVGATLELDQIPCSPLVTNYQKATGDFAPSISGGDDYELCVVVPEDAQQEAVERLLEVGTQLTKVGVITDGERVEVVDSLGQSKTDPSKGYNHFE